MKNNKRIVATIEARMTSSRLPGKVLMNVMGKPMLYFLVQRLKAVKSIDAIVLATTTNKQDDILEEFANTNKIHCYRGSENNVMSRVIEAAKHVNGDIIVEITGDCPIIDPQIIGQAISIYQHNYVDYVGNAHVRSYPDGMDVQVFGLDVLQKSQSMTSSSLDLEHVTLHIRNNNKIFSQYNMIAPPNLFWPELGLTLDEIDDYILLKTIIMNFKDNPLFECIDVVKYLRENSGLLEINNLVKRKGYA